MWIICVDDNFHFSPVVADEFNATCHPSKLALAPLLSSTVLGRQCRPPMRQTEFFFLSHHLSHGRHSRFLKNNQWALELRQNRGHEKYILICSFSRTITDTVGRSQRFYLCKQKAPISNWNLFGDLIKKMTYKI